MGNILIFTMWYWISLHYDIYEGMSCTYSSVIGGMWKNKMLVYVQINILQV